MYTDVTDDIQSDLTENTLVNVYVDLVVFTRIAGTSETGSGRYWCKYYIEKHVICLKNYRIRSFFKYSVCAWRFM